MQSKKLIESQFIVKITDIMKQHPEVLKWTDNGTQLHLVNIDIFTQKVLSQYFRHSNFNSFIRQLNIYSFNKTKRIEKSIWFKHQIFKRGNQNNFFLIQRKRKFKELQNYQERFEKQCEYLIIQVNNKRQITSQVKQVIVSLLEYKYVSHVNLKRIKCELDALNKDLKDLRNKKIHELATELKSDLLPLISQLTAESKKIDQFISKNFLKAKEPSETKQIPEPIPSEFLFSRQLEQVYGTSQSYSKSRSLVNQELQQYYLADKVRQNSRSYNSFHVFLEDFNNKKEQFAYDHKLCNPFHSQNSFMFLPNYVTASSQLPYDGRLSVQFPSFVNQNHQAQEKNALFDNFDESASISFVDVKDFEEKEKIPAQES